MSEVPKQINDLADKVVSRCSIIQSQLQWLNADLIIRQAVIQSAQEMWAELPVNDEMAVARALAERDGRPWLFDDERSATMGSSIDIIRHNYLSDARHLIQRVKAFRR